MSLFLQSGLLCWYFVSLYLVAIDRALPIQLKITGEIINLLCIGFIATSMFNEYVGNIIYYVVGLILIAWYLYFTPQDWNNPGYTPIEKYGYTAIDIITLLYLFISLSLSYINKTLNELNIIKDIINIKRIIFNF